MKELKFNEEMQRAKDEGRKTQTRRVIETDSKIVSFLGNASNSGILPFWKTEHIGKFIFELEDCEYFEFCPYGKIGDINNGCLITDIRVARLQDISEEDCIKEGIVHSRPFGFRYDGLNQFETAKKAFHGLWESIYPNHPTKAWELNPYVWVIKFENV